MKRSFIRCTVAAWAPRALLVVASSALVLLPAGAVSAQQQPAASTAVPMAIPTPAVSDSTRAATAAALQNSTQNAWQTLQRGQMLQNQLQQQSANEQFRARYGY